MDKNKFGQVLLLSTLPSYPKSLNIFKLKFVLKGRVKWTGKWGTKVAYGYCEFASMWKFNFPKLHVAGAYPVNLFSLNWYNFFSLMSRTSILQVQLIFSLVQLFFSEGQLMYQENKSCTTEKKSCTRENKSCTWSIIVLLNGAQKLYQLGENKFTG